MITDKLNNKDLDSDITRNILKSDIVHKNIAGVLRNKMFKGNNYNKVGSVFLVLLFSAYVMILISLLTMIIVFLV